MIQFGEILKHLNELHTLNGFFSLIFVALFLTIFEICLYYIVIVPKLKKNINTNLNNVIANLKDRKISLSINNIIDDMLTKILNKLNNNNNNLQDDIKDIIRDEIRGTITKEIQDMLKNSKKIEPFEKDVKINNRKYSNEYDVTKDAFKTLTNKITKILENYNINVDVNLQLYIEILLVTNFDKKIYNILSTLNNDEKHIIKMNNYNTYVIAFFIILNLLILLLFLYHLISSKNDNNGVHGCVYLYSIITVFIIILFQINFYFFGINYNYLGSKGNEELIVFLLNKFNNKNE